VHLSVDCIVLEGKRRRRKLSEQNLKKINKYKNVEGKRWREIINVIQDRIKKTEDEKKKMKGKIEGN
jgi:heme oxygenase